MYVYGLTATNLGYGAENDKSYASLGLEAGDKIKIRGYRGSYKQKIEVLYPWFIEKVTEGGGGGGGEVQPGNTVSFETNSGAQTWTAATDGTYGAGFATSTKGMKLGIYKHTGTTNLQAPNAEHVRIYKNSVLCIESEDGAPIKKVTISCPSTDNGKYCVDMAGLVGSGSATADKSAMTITWTGSASKIVLHANEGQVRMTKIVLEF